MIFNDYWKVIVLNFSEMGNTVFFWAKKLMERCYLLITEKILFRRKYGLVLIGNTVFLQPKSWWKDDIYLFFLCFPYFRTWEIWFFVQCLFHYWFIPESLLDIDFLLSSVIPLLAKDSVAFSANYGAAFFANVTTFFASLFNACIPVRNITCGMSSVSQKEFLLTVSS